MKKLGILLIVLVLGWRAGGVRAATSEDYGLVNKQRVTLAAGEIVNRDYVAMGEVVEIAGTVNGDVYVLGGQVLVNGAINGDLIILGGKVTVNGSVKQNLRGIGGQININGGVGRNVTLMGGDVEMAKAAVVGGNVMVTAGNLTAGAPVMGNLTVGAGNVTLSNRVEGDVLAGMGEMLVTSTGAIEGDLVYWSEKENNLTLMPEKAVAGLTEYRAVPTGWKQWQENLKRQTVAETMERGMNGLRLLGLAGMVLVGFVIVHLLPNWSYQVIRRMETGAGATAITGAAVVVLTPFVGVFLMMSMVGIPLALMLMVVYGMALYLAQVVFAYWLGARMLNRLGREADKTVTLLVGMGVRYVLTTLALVGPIVMILGAVIGMGALLQTDRQVYLQARQKRWV